MWLFFTFCWFIFLLSFALSTLLIRCGIQSIYFIVQTRFKFSFNHIICTLFTQTHIASHRMSVLTPALFFAAPSLSRIPFCSGSEHDSHSVLIFNTAIYLRNRFDSMFYFIFVYIYVFIPFFFVTCSILGCEYWRRPRNGYAPTEYCTYRLPLVVFVITVAAVDVFIWLHSECFFCVCAWHTLIFMPLLYYIHRTVTANTSVSENEFLLWMPSKPFRCHTNEIRA